MGRKRKILTKSRLDAIAGTFQVSLSAEIKKTLSALLLAILAVLITLSLLGLAGRFGITFQQLLFMVFGFVTYLLPVILLVILALLVKNVDSKKEDIHPGKRTFFGSLLMLMGFLGIWHLFFVYIQDRGLWDFSLAEAGAGLLGTILSSIFLQFFGYVASAVILVGFFVAGIVILTNLALVSVFELFKRKPTEPILEQKGAQLKINTPQNANFIAQVVDKEPEPAKPTPVAKQEQVLMVSKPKQQELIPDAVVLEEKTDWKLPSFELLENKKTAIDSGNIEGNAAIIRKTLADFGISVEMGEVNVGPTVTQYTFSPAAGVKLSQIAGLKNNLALALAASSIRMELPIPGKPLVGIEVPNKASSIVRLRDVMQTPEFVNHKSPLAFALGRDVAGGVQIADIAKMPHLLIAGSTNTGKSVTLNALILSLLYRNTPQKLKLILIDPKRVEMTLYNGIPHLITAPITEADKAVNAMKWAVGEMEHRYKLIAETHKRNIVDYNESAAQQLPYIVIIIDEMADLMVVAQADIEAAIVRLAQMARAVGIHLVLATQSPRVDIITGLIKANMSSRIAFKVTSQSESRIILDISGAEQLLGNGDMLFVSSTDANKPKRVQGSYVSESEVKKVADFFKQQAGLVMYNDEVVERPKVGLNIPGFSESNSDDMFEEAKEEVLRSGKASASFLQRRLRVGYARAARLLDLLEQQGIVGPGEGAKPREVFGVSGLPVGEDDDNSDFQQP